jgi:hypothetical protein
MLTGLTDGLNGPSCNGIDLAAPILGVHQFAKLLVDLAQSQVDGMLHGLAAGLELDCPAIRECPIKGQVLAQASPFSGGYPATWPEAVRANGDSDAARAVSVQPSRLELSIGL